VPQGNCLIDIKEGGELNWPLKAGETLRNVLCFSQLRDISLQLAYHPKPVRAMAEIQPLYSPFPENTRLFGSFLVDDMAAGLFIY
jgi:hypothetical protein